jgi:oligopeptide/dipeptide ABC transporter ATP-binding protein
MLEPAGDWMNAMEQGAKALSNPVDGGIYALRSLTKTFAARRWLFGPKSDDNTAVDDVSLDIMTGENVAIVGESGSGKTTLGRLLLGLEEPTCGEVQVQLPDSGWSEVSELRGERMKAFRRFAQMILQDPYASLSPRKTVFDIVSEPLLVQGGSTIRDRLDMVSEVVRAVGLTPVEEFMFLYPHQLSGGQRQRVAIARSLVSRPKFVIADEPTSMLDSTTRAAILQLMRNAADEFGITYLYITHDIATARQMCQRVAVMYAGKIVEIGETESILQNPRHPYTRLLLDSVPVPGQTLILPEDDEDGEGTCDFAPIRRESCRYVARCPIKTDACSVKPHPPLRPVAVSHEVACYEAQ